MTYDEMIDYENQLFFAMEANAEEYIENNLKLDSNYYFNLAMVELIKEDYFSAEKNMRLAADYGGVRAKSVVNRLGPKRNIIFLRSKKKNHENSIVLESFLSDTIQEAIDETFPSSKGNTKLISQHYQKAMEYFRIGEYDEARLEESMLNFQKAIDLNDYLSFTFLRKLKRKHSR